MHHLSHLSLFLLPACQQDSKGVYAAREFVWWYNGHPDQAHLPIDLSKVESVAVCGIGNVALDCARVLLRPVEQLAPTDIAQHALQQLRQSKVRTVQLCARRGPVQVRCRCSTAHCSVASHQVRPVARALQPVGCRSLVCESLCSHKSRPSMLWGTAGHRRCQSSQARSRLLPAGGLHSQGVEGAGDHAHHCCACSSRPAGRVRGR